MIQNIMLKRNQTLSRDNILRILNTAKSTYQYAKFNFGNNYYIQITYNRDLTISMSTNSRDLALYQEMQDLTKIYTQMRLVDFVFRYINKLNK